MTQAEYNSLMQLTKCFENPDDVVLPLSGQTKTYDVSAGRERFLLDYNRSGNFELKRKTQLRHNRVQPLVRLEINAPEHMNPDGELISRNHIHIFVEGYDTLRWAYEIFDYIPDFNIELSTNDLLIKFCKYCNIDMGDIVLPEVL